MRKNRYIYLQTFISDLSKFSVTVVTNFIQKKKTITKIVYIRTKHFSKRYVYERNTARVKRLRNLKTKNMIPKEDNKDILVDREEKLHEDK